jgi:predicted O-methyltransferase YrrM
MLLLPAGGFTVRLVRNIAKNLLFPVPGALRRRQREADTAALAASLREHFRTSGNTRLSEAEFATQLSGRLADDRRHVVPWIDAVLPLDGARILEIGCGTGSSTVALAEQGAKVTGVDIDEASLTVAEERCRAYDVAATLVKDNAAQVLRKTPAGSYDAILFFAVIEHMLPGERHECLTLVRPHIERGTLIGIVETPNRLWPYDGHTALLPFYHWLPDELAAAYARFSPRSAFNAQTAADETFHRWGRGASYHEFELALGDLAAFAIVSQRQHEGLAFEFRRTAADRRWSRMLHRRAPHLHPGWCDEYLNLLLRKR